jgi:hypothetical protein
MKRNRQTMDYKNALKNVDETGELATWLFGSKFPKRLQINSEDYEDSIQFVTNYRLDKSAIDEIFENLLVHDLFFTSNRSMLKCKFVKNGKFEGHRGSAYSLPDIEKILQSSEDEFFQKEKTILSNFMLQMVRSFPVNKKPKLEKIQGRGVTLQFSMCDFQFTSEFSENVLGPNSELGKHINKYEIYPQEENVVFLVSFSFNI